MAKECAREKEADDVDCAGFCLCRQWSGVEVEGVGCVGGIAQCAGNESPFADGGFWRRCPCWKPGRKEVLSTEALV